MYHRPNANPSRSVPPPPLCLGGRLSELSKPIDNAPTGRVINRRRHSRRDYCGGLHHTKLCSDEGSVYAVSVQIYDAVRAAVDPREHHSRIGACHRPAMCSLAGLLPTRLSCRNIKEHCVSTAW